MSLDSLLVHDVTIRRAAVTTDRYHNPTVKDWNNVTDTATKAWIHQQSHEELRNNGREAQLGGWVAFLPAEVDVDGGDRLIWDDLTFEVDGPPRRAWTPRGEHHVEAPLRHVEG